jgi:hypothetical protein
VQGDVQRTVLCHTGGVHRHHHDFHRGHWDWSWGTDVPMSLLCISEMAWVASSAELKQT